jgi:hypothetical protein
LIRVLSWWSGATATETRSYSWRSARPFHARNDHHGQTVALGAELRGRGELREQHVGVVGRLGVPEPGVRVAGVEVQAREVVAERRVVHAPLLEDLAGESVERDVVLAGQHVGAVEERPRLRDDFGDELVVLVEGRVVGVGRREGSRESGHVRTFGRRRGSGGPEQVRFGVRANTFARFSRAGNRRHRYL